MWSYFSGQFVTMNTVLLILITNDHQSSVIQFVISDRLCGCFCAHRTWLCNKNNLSIFWFMHEINDGSQMSWHSIRCYNVDSFFFSVLCWAVHSCRVWRVVRGSMYPVVTSDFLIPCCFSVMQDRSKTEDFPMAAFAPFVFITLS